jgi:N-methylhydantoinase A
VSNYIVGVDIGGTFTDCAMVDEDGAIITAKTLSTHSTSPVEGVLNGLEILAAQGEMSVEEMLAQTERFSHGTTIGTNLVVERNGAKVGLLATKGHGDALMMMRGGGRTAGVPADQIFDAHNVGMPTPLVPRRRVVEIEERIDADGNVVVALDDDHARAQIKALLEEEVEAIAVCLLWSVANPAHEVRIGELIAEAAPDVYFSLSSDISTRQGEYERAVAAVVNSYVGPASRWYLRDLAEALSSRGLQTAPYIMQASGGVVPIVEALQRPLRTIGSGPAGGLAGTVTVSRGLDHKHIIATDMGGTSFEVGLVVEGQPTLSSQAILEKYTYHSTHLDLRSIACGGGSIAYVDPQSGALRVGPQSAGSDPGPACYGKGTLPTVTDADLVLGLLDPETFLGGRMELDMDAAKRAIQGLGDQIGLSLEETAAGIVQINAHAAATLIRQRTIEQGLDPRDFVVYAFGGAGPVHAFAYARELGVDSVTIPLGNGASTLSAYGAASGDLLRMFEGQVDFVSPFDPGSLAAAVADLEAQAIESMTADGIAREDIVLERTAMMRYAEQYLQELHVPMPEGEIDAAYCKEMEEIFTSNYARLYSKAALALFQAIDIFTIRVTARVLSSTKGGSAEPTANGAPRPSGSRMVHWPGGEPAETRVYTEALAPGDEVEGPAIVELPYTTVAVAAGQSLRARSNGTLNLSV